MKKKIFTLVFVALLSITLVCGCGSKKDYKKEEKVDTEEKVEEKTDDEKENDDIITHSFSCAKSIDKVSAFYNGDILVKMEEELIFESNDIADNYVIYFNRYYVSAATSNNNVVTIVLDGDNLKKFLADSSLDASEYALRSKLEKDGFVCK